MKVFGTTGTLALVLFSISAGAAEYPAASGLRGILNFTPEK